MRNALDKYLETHSIQDTVDKLEENIKNNFNENIVIHHKQVLSFLSAVRVKDIDNDRDAALQFLLSKELSRTYRVKEKFCEQGNTEGVNLVNEDINFIYGLMVEIRNYVSGDFVTEEYILKHPERFTGEQKRLADGIITKRKPKEVFQLQDL